MIIRTENELNLFEKAIARCKKPVYLLTPEGIEFDLKKPAEFIKALAELLKVRKDRMESELYTNCSEDEGTMFDYFIACRSFA